MGHFSNLFNNKNGNSINEQEHAVIVHFQYGSTDIEPIFELEAKLEKVISSANVGEYDGNEIAADGSDGFLFMYGPDADKIFDVVFPVLKTTPYMKAAKVNYAH